MPPTRCTFLSLGLLAFSGLSHAESSLDGLSLTPDSARETILAQKDSALAHTPAGKRETLLQIYLLAYKHNAELQEADAAYQSAQAQTGIARSSLLPKISYEYRLTETYEHLIGQSNFANSGFSAQDRSTSKVNLLTISQDLYKHDLWVALDGANTNEARALAQREAIRQQLIIRVAQAYFDVLAAQDLKVSSEKEKAALEVQLERAEARFQVGLADIVETKETQAAYDLSIAREIEALNLLENELAALAVITGHPHTRLAPLSDRLTPMLPEPPDIEQWTATALEHNLNHMIHRRDLEFAQQEVDFERAKHWPSLSMNMTWEDSKSTGGLLSNGEGNRYNTEEIGLKLSVPLFLGGATYYRTEKAAHDRAAASARLLASERETEQLARSAYRSVTLGVARVRAFERAWESAQIDLEAHKSGLQVGTRSTVDVVESTNRLYAAQRDLLKARYDFLMNTLHLRHASGQLGVEDIEWISRLLD